jgi:hypothetical protein
MRCLLDKQEAVAVSKAQKGFRRPCCESLSVERICRIWLAARMLLKKQLTRSWRLEFALLDARFAADGTAQVEQAGTTHLSALQQLDFSDGRGDKGENALHTDAAGYLADGEGLGGTCPFDLDDIAFENLDSLLVSFYDAVADGNSVTRTEVGEVNFLRYLLLYVFNRVHFYGFFLI